MEGEGLDGITGTTSMLFDTNEEDPYIIVKEEEGMDSEGEDDYQLRESDALLITCHTEEDYSALEIHIYEENTGIYFIQ